MEISSLKNNYLNSIANDSERITDKYSFLTNNSFDTLLAKANSGNQDLSSAPKENLEQSKNDINDFQNSSDNSIITNRRSTINDKTNDNADFKPLSKEIKDSLREAGVPDDDLNKLNNLKDLKKYLSSKMLSENSKDSLNINLLLNVLAVFMNGSFSKNDILNLKDKITSDMEALLNNDLKTLSGNRLTKDNIVQLLGSLKENAKNILKGNLEKLVEALKDSKLPDKFADQLLSKIRQQIFTDVSSKFKGTGDIDIFSQIQKELAAAFNETADNLKSKQKETSTFIDKLKVMPEDIGTKNLQLTAAEKNSTETSSGGFESKENQSKTEDSFLKSILSDNNSGNNNDKILKVSTFMSQFSNLNVNNSGITKIEDVIISKNNFSNDIIKAFKYMETNNLKDLTVKITPKELGEVVIKLTMEGGAMKASITASNRETYNLLNSNLSDITNKLQNNDIKIQNLSLNIYNEDTTFFKDGSHNQDSNNQQNERNNQSIAGISEENDTLDSANTNNNNVDMLA